MSRNLEVASLSHLWSLQLGGQGGPGAFALPHSLGPRDAQCGESSQCQGTEAPLRHAQPAGDLTELFPTHSNRASILSANCVHLHRKRENVDS